MRPTFVLRPVVRAHRSPCSAGRVAQTSQVNDAVAAAPGGLKSISCPYCREDVATGGFASRAALQRVFSAQCPSCTRRIVVGARTWRHWLAADPVVLPC